MSLTDEVLDTCCPTLIRHAVDAAEITDAEGLYTQAWEPVRADSEWTAQLQACSGGADPGAGVPANVWGHPLYITGGEPTLLAHILRDYRYVKHTPPLPTPVAYTHVLPRVTGIA